MKDNKTLIAVLISLVVVVVAFYIRVSPGPSPEEVDAPILEQAPTDQPSDFPGAVPPAPGNTATPPVVNEGDGPQ